jgi:hypothetical protein
MAPIALIQAPRENARKIALSMTSRARAAIGRHFCLPSRKPWTMKITGGMMNVLSTFGSLNVPWARWIGAQAGPKPAMSK